MSADPAALEVAPKGHLGLSCYSFHCRVAFKFRGWPFFKRRPRTVSPSTEAVAPVRERMRAGNQTSTVWSWPAARSNSTKLLAVSHRSDAEMPPEQRRPAISPDRHWQG